MTESFVSYRSFHEALKDLSREQYGNVMFAINEYALNQVEVELSGVEKLAFTLIKPQLDANIRRQESGGKGGRPRKTDIESEKPTVSRNTESEKPTVSRNDEIEKPNENYNENENENVNVNENALARACEATDFGSLQREAYALLEEHNASAKDGKKIPVSNSLTSFSQKEARDLVAVVQGGSPPEIVIPALKNYLSLAARTDSWKTYFSWRDFIKNFVNFTPEYFSEDRFAAGRNARAIDAVDRATAESIAGVPF